MKHKLLKFITVLMLGFGIAPLHGQKTLHVKTNAGSQTEYSLSTIRKLTFPSPGNLSVIKNTGNADNYSLSNIRYLRFTEVGNGIRFTTDVTKSSLELYPNPVADMLNIKVSGIVSHTATVELFSMDGKVLHRAQFKEANSELKINVSQLKQGIYFCRVNNGISIETIKFTKQ